MRKQHVAFVEIPESVECKFDDGALTCKKGNVELTRKISILGTRIKVKDSKIELICEKANKKNIAVISSNVAHVKNMLSGLEEKFVYEMEICNVHFPITVKVENDKVVISNFLGEKMNRFANILSGVEVGIKGQVVTVSGNDLEKTGQTAANIEKASSVPDKDRRIFQDGIFMTSKPGGAI